MSAAEGEVQRSHRELLGVGDLLARIERPADRAGEQGAVEQIDQRPPELVLRARGEPLLQALGRALVRLWHPCSHRRGRRRTMKDTVNPCPSAFSRSSKPSSRSSSAPPTDAGCCARAAGRSSGSSCSRPRARAARRRALRDSAGSVPRANPSLPPCRSRLRRSSIPCRSPPSARPKRGWPISTPSARYRWASTRSIPRSSHTGSQQPIPSCTSFSPVRPSRSERVTDTESRSPTGAR